MTNTATITLTRGDTIPIEATIKKNGKAIDITGSVIKFSFKSDSTPIVTITGTITDALNGNVSFYPTEADMSTSGRYSFDIQREYDGMKSTHLRGTLVLEDDVTP